MRRDKVIKPNPTRASRSQLAEDDDERRDAETEAAAQTPQSAGDTVCAPREEEFPPLNADVLQSPCADKPVLLRAPTSLDAPRRKNKAFIDRRAPEWSCIAITAAGDSAKSACWTVSRIKDHILGVNGSKGCTGDSDEFFEMKEKVAGKRIKVACDKRTCCLHAHSDAASSSNSSCNNSARCVARQVSIESSMQTLKGSQVDEAIARLIYA